MRLPAARYNRSLVRFLELFSELQSISEDYPYGVFQIMKPASIKHKNITILLFFNMQVLRNDIKIFVPSRIQKINSFQSGFSFLKFADLDEKNLHSTIKKQVNNPCNEQFFKT